MRKKLFIAFFALANCLFASTAFAAAPDSVKAVVNSSSASSTHELCLSYTNPLSSLFANMYMNDYYYGNYNSSSNPFFPVNNLSLPTYGLAYKYHFTERMALRLGLDLNTSNTSFKSSNNSSAKEVYGLTQFGASIGLEMNKGDGKTQWFAGGDLFYQHFGSNYKYSETGTVENYSLSSNSVGLSPLFGVRYYISKIISVSAESKLNIFYSHYKIDETKSYSGSGNDSFYTYTGGGLNIKISPIGQLGVNIHF